VRPDPDISVNVDIRNPGQFFACCGLLEISSRLWPGSEGWFEIAGRRATYRIATNNGHRDPLGEIVRTVSQPDTVIETDVDYYDAALRPLMLVPVDLRLDWWIDGGVNMKSPLKMWAGQQRPLRIMTDMQTESRHLQPGPKIFNESRSMTGRFGIDAASSWTARGLGWSPHEQKIAWPTYPATEIFAAIGLQRCRPQPNARWFAYHIWTCPLEIAVAPAAAVMGKGQIAAKYTFEAKMRNRQYGSFDWGRSWSEQTTTEGEET
jgi:CRISPR-associated protein Csx14